MFLTRDCEVGLRAALYLAMHGGREGMGSRQIAKEQSISRGYLERVLSRLAAAGVLDRTPEGIYGLAKPPESITLRALLEPFGGPLALTRCLVHHGQIHPCGKEGDCSLHAMWREVQQAVLHTMEAHTLAEMARRAAESVTH